MRGNVVNSYYKIVSWNNVSVASSMFGIAVHCHVRVAVDPSKTVDRRKLSLIFPCKEKTRIDNVRIQLTLTVDIGPGHQQFL